MTRLRNFGRFYRSANFSLSKLTRSKVACILFVFCFAAAIAAPAQTFTSLASFDGTNGANPLWTALAQGRDGNFYGTTSGAVSTGTDVPGAPMAAVALSSKSLRRGP